MAEFKRIETIASRRSATFAATALLLLTLSACSSSGPGPASSATPAASSPQVSTPAEIRSLELRQEGETVSLDLEADRPLVWTSYRDAQGHLVVELPNSLPGGGVDDLEPSSGLVAGVEVELLDDAERPLTRLVVRTREESEHSLTAEGETLSLQLLPVGYEAPVALAYEPLPDDGPAAAPPPEVESRAGYGTPEEPFVAPAPTGVAATRLTDVEVMESSGETVVLVRGDGEFAYTTFRLENPERFIIDLSGVVNTSPRSTVPVASSTVDQVRIGQFKPRPDPVSRVVFDLAAFEPPKIERGADGLRVTFGGMGTAVAEGAMESEPTLAEEVTAEGVEPETFETAPPPAIEEESMAEEMELAEVSEPTPPVSLEPAAGEPAAGAPAAEPEIGAEEMEPDTGEEIPTFQPTVEPAPSEPGEAMAVAPEMPPPSYTAPEVPEDASMAMPSDVASFEAQNVQITDVGQQAEGRIPSFGAVEVSRVQRAYVGEPVSFSLNNADLVETLRTFSRLSDLNFVIQPGVRGSVTVELNSVPWDQALEQILRINNLGTEIDGTIVRIAPLQQLRAEAEERRLLDAARAQSIPLTTMMRPLSYANASQVAQILRSRQGGSLLSPRGSVQIDQRTNTLIIRELPDYVDTVLAVIENLDTPEPQVSIEARIVEASKQFTRTLGIEWSFDQIASNEFGNTTGLEFPNNVQSDGGVSLLTGGANGFLNLSMGNILNTFRLDAALVAAESEGLVNVVSAPRVTTLNNERARIQSGTQIPIQTIANQTVTVQFVNATLQLSVIPHVTAEGTIQLEIDVSKKEPAPAFAVVGATNAPITTKEAQTKVIVRDGGTAVIGGIYEVSNNQNQDRVPGLANIPVIGHLFKNRSRRDENEELMIFITPRIVQM